MSATAIPARAFVVDDTFRNPVGTIIRIHRISGRGKHRSGHCLVFTKGERGEKIVPVGKLRRALEGDYFAPFDGTVCRVCGCTDDNCQACIDLTGEPCKWGNWDEPDLCSACEDERTESAWQDGVVSRIASEKARENPYTFIDGVPNDLYEQWRAGWLEEDRKQRGDASGTTDKVAVARQAARAERLRIREERAVQKKNQRALESLQAFTGAAKRAGFIRGR